MPKCSNFETDIFVYLYKSSNFIMKAKHSFLIVFFVILSANLLAQVNTYERLSPFKNEEFTKRLDAHNLQKLDKVTQSDQMIDLNNPAEHAMGTIDVKESEMAQIPSMEIKKDQHYTMLIKKYNLQYPYEPHFNLDSVNLENKKSLQPIRKPKE